MNLRTYLRGCLTAAMLFGAGLVYADNPATPVKEYPLTLKFEFGKADLKVQKITETEFAKLAKELENYPYAKLEIEGYADATGPANLNQKLSEDRAQVVRQHLIDHHKIAPQRVTVKAYGENLPAAVNTTEEGRTENRRVVARIYRLEPPGSGQPPHNL